MKPISLPALKAQTKASKDHMFVDMKVGTIKLETLLKVIEIQDAALAVYSNVKNYEFDYERGVNYIWNDQGKRARCLGGGVMGVNIFLYRLTEKSNGLTDFVRDPDWDSIRQGVDRKVASCPFECIWLSPKDSEVQYWRPKSIDDAAVWIIQNAPEESKERWLTVFQRIKDDFSYWFESSY